MPFLLRLLTRTFSTSAQPATSTAAAASKISPAHAIYRERNLKRLVEKFKEFSQNDRFRTKTSVYEHVVRRLAIAKCFTWIEELLEGQKKYKDIYKEGFNARLISLYGKSNMFDHARKVFDEMPDRNCKRTVVTFNALLAACVSSKKFDEADLLFRTLPNDLEIKPDVVSYNTVIKAFCERGSVDKAMSLFVEMEMKGKRPDLFTFNTLLHGFYENGMFVDGEKVWSRMVERSIFPDIRSYNSKLHGLALRKRTTDSVLLIKEMKSKNIKPDVISFNSLIKGFVKEGNLEEAKHWYYELRNHNDIRPDKSTFVALLPFACEKDDFGFAFELSKDVFSMKYLVDMSWLQRVVDGLAQASKVEEAKELVKLGRDNGYHRYNLTLSLEY